MPPESLPAPRRRRPVSVTSLIDVIFLLLLFFMLSSTFSRYEEIEISAAQGGGAAPGVPPLFLQLGPETLALNGREAALGDLPARIADLSEEGATLVVSLREGVLAQRLADLLVELQGIDGLAVTVLDR